MLSDLLIRLRSLFRHTAVESELDEELQFHLEKHAEKYTRLGLTREEATRRARLDFGRLDQVKESCREARGVYFVETLVQDARYAVRGFNRNRAFTVVTVLTLALGVGANSAVFSVINAVMLRTLPVRDPQQLLQVAFQGKHDATSFVGESFAYSLFREFRQNNQSFADLVAFDSWDLFEAQSPDNGLSPAGTPIKGQLVSANFFSMLGVEAVVGRTFAPDEDSGAGAHPVAVISYAAWVQDFARDPHVVGRKLLVKGTPLTVIGVAPRHFSGVNPGKSFGVWIPLTMASQVLSGPHYSLTDVNTNWLSLIGRLKPDVTAAQASERLDALYQQAKRERDISGWSWQEQRDFFTHHIVLLSAASGADYLRRELSRPLWILMGMVGLVLLIACANVTNLLLARASTREREVAVRIALGARGWRLLRQLLTESILLAFTAAVVGILFAYWGSRILVTLMSITLDVYPDLRVLGFTSLLALMTGLAAGMAPAIGAARRNQSPALRAGAPKAMDSRSGNRLGRALTVMQVALSFVVVFAAVLLARTLRNLETLDPGFSRQNVLLFKLDAGRAGYKDRRLTQLYQQLVSQIGSAPGVSSASYSMLTPISGGGWDNRTYIEGYTPSPSENIDVYMNAVGPRFFETLGTPLLMGRSFGAPDQAKSTCVAVINQAMVRRYFADRSPIGQHIGKWKWDGRREYEVVGVVGDAKYMSLREDVPPTAYLYIPQSPRIPGDVTFEVQSAVSSSAVLSEVHEVLGNVDSRLIPEDVKTLAEQVDQSLDEERLVCTVSGCFGALAFALACIGLYGVMAYSVARRTNEIGLRMALGAEKSDVFRMVVGQGLRLALLGLSIGVVAALVLARLLTTFSQVLYGVSATDSPTIIAVSIAMVVVSVIACYIPASRAMRVDPMVTLRYE
jgi:predicted permease